MDDLVYNFIVTEYEPTVAQSLISIIAVLSKVLIEYDQSELVDVMAREYDETATDIADALRSHIMEEARDVITRHGIYLRDDALILVYPLILGAILTISEPVDDPENLIITLQTAEEPVAGVASVMGTLMETTPDLIYSNIDQVEPFLVNALITTLKGEDDAVIPLSPELAHYCGRFPTTTVANLLVDDYQVYTGGSIQYYRKILFDSIDKEDMDVELLGMVLMSNTARSEYGEVMTDLLLGMYANAELTMPPLATINRRVDALIKGFFDSMSQS